VAIYLLDTDIILDALNGRRRRDVLLAGLLRSGNSLACCPISVAEVFAGVRPKEETRTREFLRSLLYYDITWETARKAGLIKREWRGKGITLALPDLLIAAVALERDLPLITGNRKHYPMPELQLFALPEEA
jgi:predicted nucleic acid-binding protein